MEIPEQQGVREQEEKEVIAHFSKITDARELLQGQRGSAASLQAFRERTETRGMKIQLLEPGQELGIDSQFTGKMLQRLQRGIVPRDQGQGECELQQHQQRLQATQVRVQRGDGLAALRQAPPGSLHLVLLDPPFDALALFAPALQAAAQALAADGYVYLEAPAAWDEAALAACGLRVYRYLKAGAVHAHLLHRVS